MFDIEEYCGHKIQVRGYTPVKV